MIQWPFMDTEGYSTRTTWLTPLLNVFSLSPGDNRGSQRFPSDRALSLQRGYPQCCRSHTISPPWRTRGYALWRHFRLCNHRNNRHSVGHFYSKGMYIRANTHTLIGAILIMYCKKNCEKWAAFKTSLVHKNKVVRMNRYHLFQ